MDSVPHSKIRLRFAKTGDLRFVSHHDLMRCLERTLRRAAIPMAQSQGFHARLKYSFPMALALGIEGHREVLELELREPMSPTQLLDRLSAVAPPGLAFFDAELAKSRKAAQVAAVEYTVPVPQNRRHLAEAQIRALLERTEYHYTRVKPDRSLVLDLRPYILDLSIDSDNLLWIRLRVDAHGAVRPEEILETLGLRDLLTEGARLVRRDVTLTLDKQNPSSSQHVTS